jgi:hypothetical protein
MAPGASDPVFRDALDGGRNRSVQTRKAAADTHVETLSPQIPTTKAPYAPLRKIAREVNERELKTS